MAHVHQFTLRKFYLDDVGTFYGYGCGEGYPRGRVYPYFTRGVMAQIGHAWAAIDDGHSWTYNPSTDTYCFSDIDDDETIGPEMAHGEVHTVCGQGVRLYRLWPDEWQLEDDDDSGDDA